MKEIIDRYHTTINEVKGNNANAIASFLVFTSVILDGVKIVAGVAAPIAAQLQADIKDEIAKRKGK